MAKLHPYKNRTLQAGTPVKVYRNLHNQMFSIVDLATGLVVAHSRTVRIADAKFVVNESGRRRVIEEQRKNVHAFVVGTFVGTLEAAQRHEAYYNPYKTQTFVTSTGEPLMAAASVTLRDCKIFYTGRIDV